ncbi:MAG: phosphatidylserine decarboxylase family protein [Chlorobiales bacterium]|nr:phosphatidylserine decarboxylase family protein [Chlorobiales bacterium]
MSRNFSRRDFNKLVAAGAVGSAIGIFGGAQQTVGAVKKTVSSSSVAARWLPNNGAVLKRWHNIISDAVREKSGAALHPVIREFQKLIDDDPVVRMYMTQMIQQIPDKYRQHHPKNLQEFLQQLNAVLTVAPPYIPPGHGEDSALVGTPFSAILIWTMGTPAGFAAYRNARINAMFKELLGVWAKFLDSEESRYVLNDSPGGWMSAAAQKQLHMEDYLYKPDEPYWGFSSWNDFFTREVRAGARPIDGLKDNSVVVAPCDSTVYRIGRNAQAQSEFWIKSQPYSLSDMLNNEYVDQFVGGDVWQAFLSPFNYHRWHSPVTGTIRKAYVKEGLYFSQATSEGQDPTDQDHSEGYIAHVQTRAIIFIDADDPVIGLVCVMPIGMVEISSCMIADKIRPGKRIEKGEELGYFQFGGSTHCVIFRPGVIREFRKTKGMSVRFGQTIAVTN